MKVLAIDPGPEESAYVVYDSDLMIEAFAKLPNAEVSKLIRSEKYQIDECAIEMVASYGMAVGREVFETVYWIGRFCERWNDDSRLTRLVRRDVKMHLCGNNTAKDSNIRQALIDRFGPGKVKAIGLKAIPGPLYGISGDCWAALAVAVTFSDTQATVPV